MGGEEVIEYAARLDQLMCALDVVMEDFKVLSDERSRLCIAIKCYCMDFMEKSGDDLRRVKMDKIEAWACAAEPKRALLLNRDKIVDSYNKVCKLMEIMQVKISAIQSEMKYYNPR